MLEDFDDFWRNAELDLPEEEVRPPFSFATPVLYVHRARSWRNAPRPVTC